MHGPEPPFPPSFFTTRGLINIGTTVPLPHFLVAVSLKKCNARECDFFGRQMQP